MRPPIILAVAALCVPAMPAVAQIALPAGVLPQVGLPQVGVGQVLDDVRRNEARLERDLRQTADDLLQARQVRLERLVRDHGDVIECDARGHPARKGEVLVIDPSEDDLVRLRDTGFTVIGEEEIAGTGLTITRIAVPDGLSLAEGQRRAEALLPHAQVSADTLYSEAGRAGGGFRGATDVTIATAVGMIDGAPGPDVALAGQAGFAKGAPVASNHGSAVASLLQSAGVRRLYAADVYGNDPAGGNALAIARALGWLASKGVKVISISLVGPANPVIARSIAAVSARGVTVVAAVGNDGPAAPPAFPASYSDVVAVTGVDGNNHALIEAGNAVHLDYAAPGADILGRGDEGQRLKLRGTSFATPLAAARIAAALDHTRNWRPVVDAEAKDLGPRGPDKTYGRGLICAKCGR